MKKMLKNFGGAGTLAISFLVDERSLYEMEAGDIIDIDINEVSTKNPDGTIKVKYKRPD